MEGGEEYSETPSQDLNPERLTAVVTSKCSNHYTTGYLPSHY